MNFFLALDKATNIYTFFYVNRVRRRIEILQGNNPERLMIKITKYLNQFLAKEDPVGIRTTKFSRDNFVILMNKAKKLSKKDKADCLNIFYKIEPFSKFIEGLRHGVHLKILKSFFTDIL